MSLRVGFDIDGVVADFRSAFEHEARHSISGPQDPERAEAAALTNSALKEIWARILSTPDWWMKVRPFEPEQIRRLYDLVRSSRWEVVFMTKRPATQGASVQFQTQQWLEHFGFRHPAVVTVPGSRGELVNALRLDIIADDQLFNCVDVVTSSHTKGLLVLREEGSRLEQEALTRGIGVVRSLSEAIDAMVALDRMQARRKGRLQRLSDWFGRDA